MMSVLAMVAQKAARTYLMDLSGDCCREEERLARDNLAVGQVFEDLLQLFSETLQRTNHSTSAL